MVGLGECALDHVGTLDRGLPPYGSKRELSSYTRKAGGQVATALFGLGRLGLRTRFLGAVGDDEAGRLVLEPLAGQGCDVSAVVTHPGVPTQLAMIWIDGSSGERTLTWYRDPGLTLDPAEIRPECIRTARALHLDTGHLEAAISAAKLAREEGIPVVLDADAPLKGIERLLRHVDFPIVSETFAESFSGEASVSEALDALSGNGARMAVVTLGESGAVARFEGRTIESPAFEVAARDTTGAGDAFRAGFLWGLLGGCDAEGTLRTAHAVAALNCTGLGAQGGLPDRETLDSFLATRRPKELKP